MEIKINSNAEVSLSKLVSLESIESKILFYKLKDQTLIGDVSIYGKYLKKDNKKPANDVVVEFEEIVPFTIVFNRENIKIDEVKIEDFKYELFEDGVKCSFVIEIEYNDEFQEVPIEPNYELEDEEKIEVLKEMNDEISEITNKLDEKLEEFFEDREESDELIEEEVNKNFINKKEGYSKKFKNEGKTVISIYYTNAPGDIEKISKKENVGIDILYKSNENSGFDNRIIVKK